MNYDEIIFRWAERTGYAKDGATRQHATGWRRKSGSFRIFLGPSAERHADADLRQMDDR